MAFIARTVRSVLVAALTTAPIALHAQGSVPSDAATDSWTPTVAAVGTTPSRAPLAMPVGVRAMRPAAPAPAPNPFSVLTAEGKMAWGGVAIIVGAVIGGDSGKIIELGGAGVGLWGLFQFLR